MCEILEAFTILREPRFMAMCKDRSITFQTLDAMLNVKECISNMPLVPEGLFLQVAAL